MGLVHLARQRSLAREVAVKTAKPGAPPAAVRAILGEAKLTGALEHPGVIPVHALGVGDDGRPLLVMKRVHGVDFATLLADRDHDLWRTRSATGDVLAASLEILSQVCLTLEFAHRRGVVHRDIKPENIMVGEFGEVYLLDWGIALAAPEQVDRDALVGTPGYLAPEMARGADVDARTDVYLLGATLHEVLTGRCRHSGSDMITVLRSAVASDPFDYGASVPAELAAICHRAMHRDPAARPDGAAAFRAALAAFQRHRGARALSDAAAERLDRFEALLARGAAAPSDLALAYRLANESRFGFTQALREHAESRSAAAGMRRCLEASIDLELRQDHADAAEALMRDLAEPAPELAKRLAAVRAKLEARAHDSAELRSLQHDLDPTQATRRRTIGIILVCALTLGVGAAWARRSAPTPLQALELGLVGFGAILAGSVFLYRGLMTNAFNRKGVRLVTLAAAVVIVHRAIGVVRDTPVATTFAVDLLCFAGFFVAAAITMLPSFGWSAAVLLVGVGAALLWPAQAQPIFELALVGSLLVAALMLSRLRRRARDGSPSPS
jgi:serine/threonine-protein kinase